jgi:hypothetical protein
LGPAVGDLHGDLGKTVDSLVLAGVLTERDGQPAWCGGDTVVVQLGDVLDRGDHEIGQFASAAGVHLPVTDGCMRRSDYGPAAKAGYASTATRWRRVYAEREPREHECLLELQVSANLL